MSPARTAVALLHHPVLNQQGRRVATAVTNLDVHDIARACRTFGLDAFYLATPLEAQQRLVERILGHWRTGWGATHNPDRAAALSLVRLVPDLAAAVADLAERHGAPPRVVVTSARPAERTVDAARLRSAPDPERPLLLVFGTGSGLADEILEAADDRLAPLSGPTAYNHLSVRSAVAIYLDRLFGR
jgi:hypothetical protein